MRKLSGWLVLLLSAAMMAGCGGDSDGQSGGGANALSVTGLTSVEIRDKASGRMLAFQRITQDGAMRTVVDTFQYQGQDTSGVRTMTCTLRAQPVLTPTVSKLMSACSRQIFSGPRT